MDEVYDEDDQVIEAAQVDILQLKDNNIPKGLIPLEDLFDQDDVARKFTLVPMEKGVEDMNIGTTDKQKMIKLCKSLSSKAKEKYIRLLSEFFDVFAWDYADLEYDNKII